MNILISLGSRKLRNGNNNPKNYPYAKELVKLLRKQDHNVIQARGNDDPILGADEVETDLPLKKLAEVITGCHLFISVDSFIQHYCTYLGKRGIVIFSRSDPLIFGYPQNVNLLKSRDLLRPWQFGTWEEDTFTEEAFVRPEVVMDALKSFKFF